MKQPNEKNDYNYKIVVSYDGTRYQGWQQLGEKEPSTIQGILTELLSKHCMEPIHLFGAGRTDAKVHAMGQVANFHTSKRLEQSVLPKLNNQLPPDIQLISLEQVPLDFHSRYSAIGKQYTYTVYCQGKPDPFIRNFCMSIEESLDIPAMEEAAKLLLGTHDFAGFASKMLDGRSTVRTISRIAIKEHGNVVTFFYEGDGFLYHMLRIVTGTLLEVGLHKRTVDSLREILKTGDRSLAGPTVEGKGLALLKINYK